MLDALEDELSTVLLKKTQHESQPFDLDYPKSLLSLTDQVKDILIVDDSCFISFEDVRIPRLLAFNSVKPECMCDCCFSALVPFLCRACFNTLRLVFCYTIPALSPWKIRVGRADVYVLQGIDSSSILWQNVATLSSGGSSLLNNPLVRQGCLYAFVFALGVGWVLVYVFTSDETVGMPRNTWKEKVKYYGVVSLPALAGVVVQTLAAKAIRKCYISLAATDCEVMVMRSLFVMTIFAQLFAGIHVSTTLVVSRLIN